MTTGKTLLAAVCLVLFTSTMPLNGQSQTAMPPTQYILSGPLTTEQAAGPDWAKNQPLYQAYPHDQWSKDFQPGSYFRRTEALLPALKTMGVGILWLLPVHPRGPAPGAPPPPHIAKTAQFQSLSPYCVRDYYAVDPHWGTPEELHHLIARAHALGLHVMMDMVLNHTSWGNPLLVQHPGFYKKDADGDIAQAGPWKDIAQLDYGNHDVWRYMRDMLTHWVRDFDVDGFRMDAAGMVPLPFWVWLRPQLNALKPVLLLAEDDNPKDYPTFDMTYNWSLQPLLWGLARRGGDDKADALNATALDTWLLQTARDYPHGAVPMNHLDNHDLNPASNPWVNGAGWVKNKLAGNTVLVRYGDGYRAFSVLTATLPGRPMVYNGQELFTPGDKDSPPVPDTPQKLRSAPNYDFYRRLLNAYQTHPALYAGEFIKLPSGHDDAVYAFLRRRGRDEALVVVNLSDQPQQAALQMDPLPGHFHELFTGAAQAFPGPTTLSLEPWAYRVYLK